MRVSPFVATFRQRSGRPWASKPLVVGRSIQTYGHMADGALRLATLFRDRGIGPGNRGVIVSKDEDMLVLLFLGMVANGVTPIVLDPDAMPDELHALFEASDAAIHFADGAVVDRLFPGDRARHGPRLVALDGAGLSESPSATGARAAALTEPMERSFAAELASLPTAPSLPEDISAETSAYILFTSGTTSLPKGVEISHGAIFANLTTMSRQYGYGPETRLLNVLPLHHADGLIMGPVVAFFNGGTVYRPMRFAVPEIPRLLETIAKARITHFQAVPAMLSLIDRFGDDYRDAFKTADFRFVISSGGALTEDVWRRFEERFATSIVNVYGLTEAACELMYSGPDAVTRKVGTNGKPVGCDVRVVDDDGRAEPPGEVGELVVRAVNFMTGYFHRPDETAAVIRDGWFHTGDLAVIDEEGFFRIVGRKKNVIITGGLNVHPEDVTRAILAMPGVRDAVTFGMPDEAWGERVVVCVEPDPASRLSRDDVMAYCRAKLSPEKVPNRVYVVATLPRGPVGKVLLPEVKRMIVELDESSNGGFTMDHELDLYRLAANTFKIHFRDLSPESSPDSVKGWDSLAHVDFLVAVEKKFGVRLAPKDIMNIRTLGDALKILKARL